MTDIKEQLILVKNETKTIFVVKIGLWISLYMK